MKYTNIYLRFKELSNGDICVCELKDKTNWNKTGVTLGVYYDGLIYDTLVLEDDQLPHEQWEITDLIEGFAYTGIKA